MYTYNYLHYIKPISLIVVLTKIALTGRGSPLSYFRPNPSVLLPTFASKKTKGIYAMHLYARSQNLSEFLNYNLYFLFEIFHSVFELKDCS